MTLYVRANNLVLSNLQSLDHRWVKEIFIIGDEVEGTYDLLMLQHYWYLAQAIYRSTVLCIDETDEVWTFWITILDKQHIVFNFWDYTGDRHVEATMMNGLWKIDYAENGEYKISVRSSYGISSCNELFREKLGKNF